MPGSRIQIVEDELIVSLEIKETLRRLGYEVVARVTTGEEAIEKGGELRPDLILMDIRLAGEMDGITAAKTIINMYDIPIIFLTAHSDEATLKRAIEVSPSGYLLKPFNEKELLTNIEMSLHKHKVKQNLHPKRSEPESKLLVHLQESGHPFLYLTPQLLVSGMNKEAEQLLGKPLIEIVTKPLHSVFHKREVISDTTASFSPDNASPQVILPDQLVFSDENKKETPVTLSLGWITSDEGMLQSLIGSLDTSIRKSTQITGNKSQIENFTTFIQSLDVPGFIINKEKLIVGHNTQFFDLLSMIGVSRFELEHPIYQIRKFNLFGEISVYDEIFTTSFSQTEVRKYNKAGKLLFIRFHRFPILQNKKVSHVVTLMFDATSEKMALDENKRIHSIFDATITTIDTLTSGATALRPQVAQLIQMVTDKMNVRDPIVHDLIDRVTLNLNNLELACIEYGEQREGLLTIGRKKE